LQVVEFGEDAREVTDAIGIRVHEGANVDLVDDRVFVPERVAGAAGFFHSLSSGPVIFVAVTVAFGSSVISLFEGRINRKMCAGIMSGRSAT
jgi:hypothetical protein